MIGGYFHQYFLMKQLFLNPNIFKIYCVDQHFLKGIPLKYNSGVITAIRASVPQFQSIFMSTSYSS